MHDTAAEIGESDIHPAGADPWCKLLFTRGLWPRLGAAAVIVFAAVLPLAVSVARGSFRNSALTVDALHDWGYYNSFFLVLPFVSWFTVYYLNGLQGSLEQLRQAKIVDLNDNDYAEVVGYANARFSHWAVSWFGPAVAVLSVVAAAQGIWVARLNTWSSPLSGHLNVEAWATIPAVFILYHTIAALVARVAVIAGVVKKFLVYPVDSNALHPDGSGGFSPLGKFALRMTLAGLFIGLACLIGVAANTMNLGLPVLSVPTILILSGYAIGLTVGFFVPLYPARKRMKDVKDSTLRDLSKKLNGEMAVAMKGIREEADTLQAADNLQAVVEKVKSLRELYDVARRMPVYPFNASYVVKFVSSVMWPIVLLLIGEIFDAALN